jgi:hypothetical protein
MPLWAQHLLVLLAVCGAAAFVLRQGYRTLMGRRSKLGSCCDKGCGTTPPEPSKQPTQRIVFLPVESLTSRTRKR